MGPGRLTAIVCAAFWAFGTLPPPASAQPASRIATTAEALVAAPVFFHGKQIVIRNHVVGSQELARLEGTAKPVFVFWKEPQPSAKDAELRGEFWDLGRLQPGDARFSSYNFDPVIQAASSGQWPARDQVFVILSAVLVEAPLPPGPTIRAIALAPERYAEREVKVVGRFRGRNLYGDLPTPLNKSKWDFVLQSADATIWVSGMRPRGKDLDLDPGARVDTSRWIEVIGVVRTNGPVVWIEASGIRAAAAPSEVRVDITVPERPREPPPAVVFSAPVADEVDVARTTAVRIQFSRDMDGPSIRNRIRVSYAAPPSGAAPPPVPAFTATYNEGARAIEIRFNQPLERFLTVKVELLEGITAYDGQPLPPWTLAFMTGG
jgi:hypothetical protein